MKLPVAPPGMSCGCGDAVCVAMPAPPLAVAATPAAVAWPVLVTSRRNVNVWPVLACPGVSWAAAVKTAGLCTVAGPALAVAVTAVPLSASFPLALTLKLSVPADVVWKVHANVRVDCAGMSWAAGELISVIGTMPMM